MSKAVWKSLKASTWLLLFGILLVACGKSPAGPEKVAVQFLNHLSNADFEKAAELCDEDTKGLMMMVAGMAKTSDAPAEMKESTKMGKIQIITADIQGDKAKVTYKQEGSEETEALDLVKVDGKWLVTINKEDLNKEDSMNDMNSEDLDFENESMMTEPYE
jgi:hypothetical protein